MQQGALPGRGGFIASAATDKGFALWTPSGGHVGDFGQQQPWDWEDSNTWKSSVDVDPVPVTTMLQTLTQAQTKQPAHMHDAFASLLLRNESSESIDDACVYSSGDEMLPECFKEQSDDD